MSLGLRAVITRLMEILLLKLMNCRTVVLLGIVLHVVVAEMFLKPFCDQLMLLYLCVLLVVKSSLWYAAKTADELTSCYQRLWPTVLSCWLLANVHVHVAPSLK